MNLNNGIFCIHTEADCFATIMKFIEWGISCSPINDNLIFAYTKKKSALVVRLSLMFHSHPPKRKKKKKGILTSVILSLRNRFWSAVGQHIPVRAFQLATSISPAHSSISVSPGWFGHRRYSEKGLRLVMLNRERKPCHPHSSLMSPVCSA